MSRSFFYNGYTYFHGPFKCVFRLLEHSGQWRVEIHNRRSGVLTQVTLCQNTKTEAYAEARRFCTRRLAASRSLHSRVG